MEHPTLALAEALATIKTEHMAAITDPEQIGGLLRAIDTYKGHATTRAALTQV